MRNLLIDVLQIYSLALIFCTNSFPVTGELQKEFYIVFLEDHLGDQDLLLQQRHINILTSLKGCEDDARESLVYSYTKSFNAFAAELHEHEANRLSGMDGVLSVYQNKYHQLHTTESWDFIGLAQNTKRRLKMERDIIVGVLDTGITPESESFSDYGLGPPPVKWKGSCLKSANFSGCNNKLIGAQHFKLDKIIPDAPEILSPIDVDGHGTHTSSTVAGALVPNATLSGLAKGTARGAVPSARIAMYKVCWQDYGCSDMDILAAFEAAIHDGVDVVSISIGGSTKGYDTNSIAIGSFHAMRKGIITVASAGNSGPSLGSVSNNAPWIFTVAASGISRQFNSKVVLGNGQTILGIGVNLFQPKQKPYPLTIGADAAKNRASKDSAEYCIEDSMDANKVKGKVVHCKLSSWGVDSVIKSLGGIGTIIESEEFLDTPMIYMAPSTMVNSTTGKVISKYITSTKTPSGVIYKSEETRIPAPFIASFSSRGPNPGARHLLKPDIAAPGIDILAAYTPLKSLTGLKGDTQHSKFTLMSGTSMACPHVGGAAAYVKSFHPDWSPAAIKSAIMTTATPMNSKINDEAEFAYGAGQLNPRRATSPGLIYDMDDMAYIQFLCHEGYTGASFGQLIGTKSINCSNLIPASGEDAINYPTMQLIVESSEKGQRTGVFRRTVTNVGPAMAVYNASITAPKGLEISVAPTSLSFTRVSQKKSFKVVVKTKLTSSAKIAVSGSLIWKSPRHVVRSPIVVYNVQEN
ncbi:subtilisin-like protease SBT4.14 [Heracleum sosnowskyi]|uniref:Subtilisin-like protease SBT4.14 n=1 Tax=Heracleum sosnowskyi TaxID=360622 RepID=A0AAD8MKK2_9APIA|nr:subtilisin-like protease SBT4.14 [Heracleum sosnowskyi]